jgi:hypothetical protein
MSEEAVLTKLAHTSVAAVIPTDLRVAVHHISNIQPLACHGGIEPSFKVPKISVPLGHIADDALVDAIGQ